MRQSAEELKREMLKALKMASRVTADMAAGGRRLTNREDAIAAHAHVMAAIEKAER